MSAPRTFAQPIWWEKTVEYLYVSREMALYSFVAPLAGRQEAAADVVLRDINARWNLIEFKRSEADLGSEREKYDRASDPFKTFAAALGLGKKDVPHFMVFGCVDERGLLDLHARHYWGRWTGVDVVSDRSVPVGEISKFGCTYDNFVKYLNVLLALKSRTSSSSAGRPEFLSVVGIVGSSATAIALSDFIDLAPELAHRRQVEPAAPALRTPEWHLDIDLEP